MRGGKLLTQKNANFDTFTPGNFQFFAIFPQKLLILKSFHNFFARWGKNKFLWQNIHLCSVLDLLLQVVTNPHGQLVELFPLLSQTNGGVLRVHIVEDYLFLQDSSIILNLA